MISWHTYAVIAVPGLGLWACQRRAWAVLVGCSFAFFNGLMQDWRFAVASWCAVQLIGILITLRRHE